MAKSKMSVIYDGASYRRRCEPKTLDEVNQSLEQFFIDLHGLLEKHQIADATVITQAALALEPDLLNPDKPKETFVSSCLHLGNEAHALEMASYAHAYFRAEMEARLVSARASAEKRAKS